MSSQVDTTESASATQLSTAVDISVQSQSTTTTTTTITTDSIMLTGNNSNIQPRQLPLSPPDEQKLECTTLGTSDIDRITSKSMPSTPFTASGIVSTTMFSANSTEAKSNPANPIIMDDNSTAAAAACGGGGGGNASQHVQESMHLDLTAWDLDHIDSSIVCCYYDVVLRSDDLQLLSPGRWLNDTCIEFFYEYLERQIVQTDEILLMRPAIAHMIAQSTNPSEYLSVLPPQLHERAVIFLPINNHTCADTPGGSHWALLVYTRDTGTFYYYDTMNISNLSAARNMAAKAAKVLNVKHPKFLMMPTPQQDNGYDCGVYVISITELICRRLLQTSLVSKYKSDGGLRTKSGADECKDDFAGLLKRRPASASDGDIRMWRQEAEKCLEQRLRMSEFDLPSTIRTRQFLRELVVNYCEIRNPSSDSQ